MAEKRRKVVRCSTSIKHVFSGTLVHSTSESMMDICQKRIIGVDDDGKVTVSVDFLTSAVLYVWHVPGGGGGYSEKF